MFVERQVARAAAVLDEIKPGWHDQIDLSEMDMNRCHQCVLGQLYGNWEQAPWLTLRAEGANRRAFTRATSHGFIKLQRLWIAEIKARRADTFPAEWSRERTPPQYSVKVGVAAVVPDARHRAG